MIMADGIYELKWTDKCRAEVGGTIFETQEWVGRFAACETMADAARLFNSHFYGQWEMSTSSWDSSPGASEIKERPWDERYAVMQLLKGKSTIYIRMFVTRDEINKIGLDYYRDRHPRKFHGAWFTPTAELTPKGNIAVLDCFAPGHPDSDCEYAFRIYSPAGEPLTDWVSDYAPLSTSRYYELRDSH